MHLRYSCRVYPTLGQRAALARAFGCARVVHNDALAARRSSSRWKNWNTMPILARVSRGGRVVRRGAVPRVRRCSAHLSEATVKTHVARILGKLRLRDRAQAVIVAYETGLVSVGTVRPV
ncbi:hypothetical protein GCM10010430_51460 [Kitasatospora cystarginea]|uniref:HTH luxR-type domain-containing protein n=1 Tax=Kitasatospora cystarginea TaxID=58350 RepID=A0ABP5RGC1_9ACTN